MNAVYSERKEKIFEFDQSGRRAHSKNYLKFKG